MKSLFLTTILVILSLNAFAVASGDKYRCADDVSGQTFDVKIIDMGDEAATVRVKGLHGYKAFYPVDRVEFRNTTEGLQFNLLSKDHTKFEAGILIEEDTLLGWYADNGDSRSIACEKR